MAKPRGKITRSKGKNRKSVYLSDVFGIWPEPGGLHITNMKGTQEFHASISPKDGLLYDVILMLYHYGIATNP